MRRFQLQRDIDPTGVSGTGIVAEGVEFANGKVTMTWLTSVSSIAIYKSMEDVETIHSHGGNSSIVWVDEIHSSDVDLVESLADYAHEAWCGWMEYVFTKTDKVGYQDENGKMCRFASIKQKELEQWERQIDTHYEHLSEDEKESDRIQARKIIKIIRES